MHLSYVSGIQLNSANEVSGSAKFYIIELPAVRRTRLITIGQYFYCYNGYMVNNNNNFSTGNL